MEAELKEIEQWKLLRDLLKISYDYNDNWHQAIVLFKKRLKKKFFSPLENIIEEKKLEGEGFAIVTVQCALIEALASFRTGQIFNYSRNSKSPKYEYSKSKQIFVDFLNTDEIFKDIFWEVDKTGLKQLNKPFDGTEFYYKVRCGLMHEARTKAPWHINATNRPIKTEKIFIEKQGAKIKLLRSILHFRLVACVNQYSKDLAEESPISNILRRNFARKLDHMFDIPTDEVNYDWWKDK